MTPQLQALLECNDLIIATVPGCVRNRTADESKPLNSGYRILCPECNMNYTAVDVGMTVIELIEEDEGRMRPYRLWHADRMACKCGRNVLNMANNCYLGEWQGDAFKNEVANVLSRWLTDHDLVSFWRERKGYSDDAELYIKCFVWLTGTKPTPEEYEALVTAARAGQYVEPGKADNFNES